jgi:hypothetical protein
MFLCSRSQDLFVDECIKFYLIIRKIMNFNFFSKIYSQWILNCVKNVRSLMVKTVFESDVSLRNYREKVEKIKVEACMKACVSMCRLLSGVTFRLRRGFYVVTNWF